ncbi:MAG: DEAD/DEAH box helicase [Deltaproteobacteria bacterium]|nr:DEAD/DEAH box helicase [Deltaproteobacteria bacterium]
MSLIRARRTVSAPTSLSAKPTRAASRLAAPHAPSDARAFALDVPFELRAVAMAAGARWDEDHKVFLYRGASLPAALEPFRAAPWSLERRVERALNREPRRARPAASPTLRPRPHQAIAIQAILAAARAGHEGFLLADDVGLGKTITAWAAILAMPDVDSVLVTCPLAVVAHWRATLEAMGDGGKDVVVINYERLGKLMELTPEARAKVKSKKGLARHGQASRFDVVVWDESHRLKNPAAARSKLAARLTQPAGFALWLSATAGQNPLELSYLAPLLARVTGDRVTDLKQFEAWCAAQELGVTRGAFGRWEWQGDAAHRGSEKVRAMLFDGPTPAGIRRRPEDVAGWPELNRMLTPIGLDPSARALYLAAWTEFRAALALDAQGKNPTSALAATLRLRQKSSLIRVAGTVELVQELLDNGHQVAISVAFIETLNALAGALADVPLAMIHGGLAAAAREDERRRFQRGDARVVLFTVEEGISLHQGELNEVPRSMVIHDLRWSAIQMAQIEGRCHRDGRFAQVYWAYAEDTIESRIAQLVCSRIQSMKRMIGDDVETLRAIEALLREG